ncbi:hypothetical protein GCM10009413_18170 [Tatumella punctata]
MSSLSSGFPDGPGMLTVNEAPHSVWYEISAQGTGPLANIPEKIYFMNSLAQDS